MIEARRVLAAVTLGAAATAVAATAAVAQPRSHGHNNKSKAERVFTLAPDPAANPEGIAVGKHGTFYVSITGDGAIYSGSLGSDTVTPFIPGSAGDSSVGIKVHKGKLYVAGGGTGMIKVYDLTTKALVASFDTGLGGFLNDLIVTRRGDVFVTDSFRPTLWHVTAAQVAAGSGTPQGLDLSGSISFEGNGAFNLNGIVQKDKRRLIVVQTNTGQLWRIDLSRKLDAIKKIVEIKGVSVPGGDGMILDRGRLVVVQGGPPAQLNFVKLKHGARKGKSQGTQTSANLHGPSTIARDGKFYLVVNADFAGLASPPFTVAGLLRGHGHGHGNH